jgi:hypothetical protein
MEMTMPTLEQEIAAQRLRTQGEAKKRDRDALALLALISATDLQRIDSTWNRLAPRPYRWLTAAPSSLYGTPLGPIFWFDPQRLQYGHGTRGLIPPAAIVSALRAFNANAAAELARLTAAAGSGQLSIPTWQDAMTQAVKDFRLVNAAVGRGGRANLTEGDMVTVADDLEYQLGRLDRFAVQMEEETAAGSPGAAGARAGNYASAAISAFSGMRRRAATAAGYLVERNLLGQAEHCAPDPRRPNIPNCPSLTRRGWLSIGTLPDIGDRLCLWNCKCTIEYGF